MSAAPIMPPTPRRTFCIEPAGIASSIRYLVNSGGSKPSIAARRMQARVMSSARQ